MRQKLNENPVAQIALVGVLVVAVGFLLLSSMGGGSESGSEASASASTATESSAGGEAAPAEAEGTEIAASTSSVSAPASRPLPHAVDAAYADGSTIVLLIVRDGGIDDHLVRRASRTLEGMSNVNVAFFSTKAKHVARYSVITGPLGVNQVPALVVIRPRHLNGGEPAPASVTYGFQSASDIRQAIRDAIYHGPQLSYAPN